MRITNPFLQVIFVHWKHLHCHGRSLPESPASPQAGAASTSRNISNRARLGTRIESAAPVQLPSTASSVSDPSGVSAAIFGFFPEFASSSALVGYFSFTHCDQSLLSCSRLPGALCSSSIMVRKSFLSTWLTSAFLHASFKSDAVAKGAIHKSRSTTCSVCADKNGTLVPSALPYQKQTISDGNITQLLWNTA